MSLASADPRPAVILTTEGARRLTDRIRCTLEVAWELIPEAWRGRAWEALDHPTWETYCRAEFGDLRQLRIPVEQRRQLVAAWSDLGMSERAIAAGLGVSKGTVHGDRPAAAESEDDSTVVSLDGRRRPKRTRVEPAPEPPAGTRKTDRAVQLIAEQGDRGLTVRELSALTDWHHGQCSGILSPLERQGRIVRTDVVRLGCAAYIVAEA